MADITGMSRPRRLEEDGETQARSGFYVEVLLLVLALLMVIIVLVSAYSYARIESDQATDETESVIMASDIAEMYTASSDEDEFVASLETAGYDVAMNDKSLSMSRDGYGVALTLSSQTTASGNVGKAHIIVYRDDDALYWLDCERYDSGRGGGL